MTQWFLTTAPEAAVARDAKNQHRGRVLQRMHGVLAVPLPHKGLQIRTASSRRVKA